VYFVRTAKNGMMMFSVILRKIRTLRSVVWAFWNVLWPLTPEQAVAIIDENADPGSDVVDIGSERPINRERLHGRLRAGELLERWAHRFGLSWDCRHRARVALRACLGEGLPAKLVYQIHRSSEDGTTSGHIVVRTSRGDSCAGKLSAPEPLAEVAFPLDGDEKGWRRG